jgi:glycosyltransferase involved in cell wall biosynthesis
MFRFERPNAASKRRPVLCQKNRVASLRAKLGLGPSDQDTYPTFLKTKLAGDLAGKVTFHGFLLRPELIDHYYHADVFVFPPIWNEAFGLYTGRSDGGRHAGSRHA